MKNLVLIAIVFYLSCSSIDGGFVDKVWPFNRKTTVSVAVQTSTTLPSTDATDESDVNHDNILEKNRKLILNTINSVVYGVSTTTKPTPTKPSTKASTASSTVASTGISSQPTTSATSTVLEENVTTSTQASNLQTVEDDLLTSTTTGVLDELNQLNSTTQNPRALLNAPNRTSCPAGQRSDGRGNCRKSFNRK